MFQLFPIHPQSHVSILTTFVNRFLGPTQPPIFHGLPPPAAPALPGPSKDGLVPGSEERLPHWCAKSSAVPRLPAFEDDERFEPQRVRNRAGVDV